MLTTAVKATVLYSIGRPSKNANAVIAHTLLTGVPVSGLTDDHSRWPGTPPSREKDHSILRACCPVTHGGLLDCAPCACMLCTRQQHQACLHASCALTHAGQPCLELDATLSAPQQKAAMRGIQSAAMPPAPDPKRA